MSQLATIRAPVDDRDDARVTKAKLGVTWGEFLAEAAEALEPTADREEE